MKYASEDERLEAKRATARKSYHKNRDKRRLDARVYVEKRYKKHKELIDSYKKDRGCLYCGITTPIVLQFHHKDPSEKSFEIGKAIRYNLDKLMNEIAKCVVICANCHLILHERERQGQ